MAGLTIYIDDKDLKKAQKAGEVTQKYGYTWGSGSSTVEKPKNGTYYVSKTIPHKTQKQIDEEKVPSKINAVKHDMEVMKELPLPDLEYASQIASRGTPPIFKKDDDGNYVVDYIYDSKKHNAQDVMDAYLKIKDFYDKAKIHNQKAQEYKKNNFGNFLNDVVSLTTFSNWRPFDETPNGIASQLYRWYDRRQQQKQQEENIKNQLSEDGADIIDLSQNVIRLTPTSTQSTGLFNEFVEEKLPSIHRAKDYKEWKIKTFGDQFNIPVENISLYQGIEDGHFKVGNLSDFKDETLIYPVRNVKKNHLAPISKITVSGKNTTDNFGKLNAFDFEYMNSWNNMRDTTGFKESLDEVVKAINDSKYTTRNITTEELLNELSEVSYLPSFNPSNLKSIPSYLVSELLDRLNKKNKFIDDIVGPSKYEINNYMNSLLDKDKELDHKMFNILENKKYENIYKTLRADFWNKYKEHFADEEGNSSDTYTVTDTEGNTYPISELNAAILDNKTILGNNNGGIFIGDFKKITKNQLDSVNEYLSKNPSWLVRTDLGSFDTYNLDNPSLKDYLKQYFEHPNENNPNVYVVGTTQPNKLFTPTKQSGGEQENIDNTHEWKRTHWDEVDKSPTGNKNWGDYYEIINPQNYDRKGRVDLGRRIKNEFEDAKLKYKKGNDDNPILVGFRVPYTIQQEEVVLPKIESKWNTVVTLPNRQEERQMMALVPEKRTNYVDGYRTTKNGIQNMINFTDPWTLPKWTMAFEDSNGKPYSDRYYKLQNEYFDNGGKDNPLEYILNKDFDEVKTTGELETLNIPNALWYNTTKGTFMVSDENGNLNYSDYNLTPNDHYSVTDNVKIYKPKKTAITTIDQNAVKLNKFINEMNDANKLANMVNAGQNRTWNLQYQQGGPTHLQPWDEQRFRIWFNSLPEGIRNSNDYDYRGWWLENGSIPYKQILSGNGHFTDKYKLPNHPTFSNQSIYSKGNTIGGQWINNDMDFVPSQYNVRNGSDRIVDYMEFGDKGSRMFDTNGMVAQFKDGGPLGLTIVIDDEQFKKGGQIHIKEKNKGKFTKQAQSAGMSVQEFARHVLAHKDRYPASTVKRANFARNASKWSK